MIRWLRHFFCAHENLTKHYIRVIPNFRIVSASMYDYHFIQLTCKRCGEIVRHKP